MGDREYSIEVFLHGDDLDPGLVTARILLEPTRSWKRGDISVTSSGEQVVRKRGLWSLKYDEHVTDLSDGLYKFLRNSFSNIRLDDLHMGIQDVVIAVFSGRDDDPGIVSDSLTLTPAVISEIARHNAKVTIELDSYVTCAE